MQFIKNPLLITIFVSFAAGFYIDALSVFAEQIPIYIALMLYFSYPGIDIKLKQIFRRESLIALLLCGFLMPFLAWHVFSYGQIEEYRTGMFLVAASPTGIIMLVLSRSIKNADHDLILGNFLVTHFSVIVYLPILVYLFQGNSVNISAGKIFFNTVILISIPWSMGYITYKYFSEKSIAHMKMISKWFNPALFFIVISSSLANARTQIDLDASFLNLFFLVLGMYLSQSSIAYLFGKILFFPAGIRNALALSASSKNIQLTLGIAIMNYDVLTTIPIVLGIVTHHISNAVWIGIVSGKEK